MSFDKICEIIEIARQIVDYIQNYITRITKNNLLPCLGIAQAWLYEKVNDKLKRSI